MPLSNKTSPLLSVYKVYEGSQLVARNNLLLLKVLLRKKHYYVKQKKQANITDDSQPGRDYNYCLVSSFLLF